MVLSGFSDAARHRGDRAPPADATRTSDAARALPLLKTIDDFNFTYQSLLRLQMLGSALAPDFVTEGHSLILAGKPGRGKPISPLRWRIARFRMASMPSSSRRQRSSTTCQLRFARASSRMRCRPTHIQAVLVVDEVGYLTDAANMLFHVVDERHRRHRSMIFTTNKR